jgi:hypothetical protein
MSWDSSFQIAPFQNFSCLPCRFKTNILWRDPETVQASPPAERETTPCTPPPPYREGGCCCSAAVWWATPRLKGSQLGWLGASSRLNSPLAPLAPMPLPCGQERGMRHTSTALYFYGVSKKILHKPRVTFGNMSFQINYSLNYYLLLC